MSIDVSVLRFAIDARAYVRPLRASDAAAQFEVIERNRERVGRYMWFVEETAGPEDVLAFIVRSQEGADEGLCLECGIFVDDRCVGAVGLNQVNPQHDSANLSYWIDLAMEGQGLVTRSARALVNYAFNDLGLHRMGLRAATDNIRSQAVAARLGFQHEGTLRQCERVAGRYLDMEVYGLLASDVVGPE